MSVPSRNQFQHENRIKIAWMIWMSKQALNRRMILMLNVNKASKSIILMKNLSNIRHHAYYMDSSSLSILLSYYVPRIPVQSTHMCVWWTISIFDIHINKVDLNGCLNFMKYTITNAFFQTFSLCSYVRMFCHHLFDLIFSNLKSRSLNFQSKDSDSLRASFSEKLDNGFVISNNLGFSIRYKKTIPLHSSCSSRFSIVCRLPQSV